MSDDSDLLSLLYHIPVAVSEIDREGNCALLNPLGCQLLMRITPDPVLENLFTALAPDTQLRTLVQEYAEPAGVVCHGLRLPCVTLNQVLVYLEFTVHRLEADRFLVAFHDATKAVLNEQRVAQSLKNLENVLASITRLQVQYSELELVLEPLLYQVAEWVGADGAVLFRGQNPAQYDVLMRVGMMVSPDDLAKVQRVDRPDQLPSESAPILLASKNFALLTQPETAQMRDESFFLLQLFMQAAAQALENAALHEQVVRQERVSAVGQAMSSVVHDLRSPIATIKTAVEMAQGSPENAPLVSRMHSMVLRSADTAFDLVSDVLDYVRNAPLIRKPESLVEIFALVEESCQSQISRVEFQAKAEDLTFPAHARKLVRALANLVNNACEAVEDQAQGSVQLLGSADGGQVLIQVRDNGGGIPPSIRDRLFEAFVTSGKTGGTGLGLSIVQQIVAAHNGTITVETDAGGTCFSLRLPA